MSEAHDKLTVTETNRRTWMFLATGVVVVILIALPITQLDRLVMTLKDIPDIRYLRSTNPKIAKQMTNLELYHEVSNQPAIRRDLSYSVPQTYVEEDN